jgi:hypothetical protein
LKPSGSGGCPPGSAAARVGVNEVVDATGINGWSALAAAAELDESAATRGVRQEEEDEAGEANLRWANRPIDPRSRSTTRRSHVRRDGR